MTQITEEMTKDRYWESLTITESVKLGTTLAALFIDTLKQHEELYDEGNEDSYQKGWDDGYASYRDAEYD